MSDTPTGVVLPLDQLLSRRDFCRSLCVGGAALVTLNACGGEPLVVQTQKDLATGGNTSPEDLATPPQPDLAQSTPSDLASQGPVDLAQEQDLARAPDMANPNACPPQNVISSGLRPAAFAQNTATLVQAARAFICRDVGGLFCVSNICTHNQQEVRAVNGGLGGLFCMTHGSSYTLNGDVTGGPAPSPLPHFGLCVDGKGNVAIATSQNVAANKRYSL